MRERPKTLQCCTGPGKTNPLQNCAPGQGTMFNHLPLITAAAIFFLSICTCYSALSVFPPESSTLNRAFCLSNVGLVTLTIFFFFASMLSDPGFVPSGWKPPNSEEARYLDFCCICKGYKPPRSHHCRRCRRCVTRMDHHCNFIGNCVGYKNHSHFFLCLVFGLLSTIIGVTPMSIMLWRSSQLLSDAGHTALMCAEVCLLLIGAGLACLLFVQVQGLVINATYVERLFLQVARAQNRLPQRNSNPYNIGVWRNIGEVIGCLSGPLNARGEEGFEFAVRSGSHKYALQLEKRRQHECRKKVPLSPLRQHTFRVITDPLSATTPSPTRAPTLNLRQGDKVTVLKTKGDWLWGKKKNSDDHGWFLKQSLMKRPMVPVAGS